MELKLLKTKQWHNEIKITKNIYSWAIKMKPSKYFLCFKLVITAEVIVRKKNQFLTL